MKKSISLFFAVALSLLLFNGCEESYQSTYSYGIGSYEPASDTESLNIIKGYLAEVGCFTGPMIFDSESASENEQDAIAYFDVNVAKIYEPELAARLQGKDVEFAYVVADGNIIDPSGSNYMKSETYTFGSYAGE